ncbi:hypothetical protein ACFWZ2_41360 [Streptomyces sp. NPDC059002]|uniref:hypothetical protein n=1 Tax=Streptomyces sp. NPDC059002 TaxID=3346690 RepID=UPI0036CAD30D
MTNVGPGVVRTDTQEQLTDPAIREALTGIEEPLAAEDVADLIAYAASRPRHVNLSEVVALPTRQP